MRNKHFLLAASASFLLVTAACSSDDTGTTDSVAPDPATADSVVDSAAPEASDDGASEDGATQGDAAINLLQSRFDPTELTIAVGETVTFTNDDPYDHTITSRDDSPIEYDSGTFGEGETFEQTYDEAGSFEFFCEIHPTMRGTIIVE